MSTPTVAILFVVMPAIGFAVGWLLNRASDILPRFAAQAEVPPSIVISQTTSVRVRLGAAILSGLSFAFLYVRYGLTMNMLFYALVFSFFLLIAIIDIKYRLVLNVLTYPAMIVVFVGQILLAQHNLQRGLMGVLLGGGLAFGIFFLTARLKPGDLGSGDVKLATLIGLAFGFPGVLWALLAGAGLGGIVAIVLLVRRRNGADSAKLYFAYAPYLCFGAIVALLYTPFLTAL